MASSTRSRRVSVTTESLRGVGVDRAQHVRSRDRQHESRTVPLTPPRRVGLDKRAVEHLADVVHRNDLDGVEDFLLDLVQIADILRRQDEGLQARTVRSEQLVLDAADGKYLAP